MSHETLHQALRHTRRPHKTQAATLIDYNNKTAQIRIGNEVTCPPFAFSHGGWQGGTRTPDEFNAIIDIGFRTTQGEANHFVWADNVILIARHPDELQIMLNMATDAIMQAGFLWKEGSVMPCGDLADQHVETFTNINCHTTCAHKARAIRVSLYKTLPSSCVSSTIDE